jgi:hypothetical protein
MKGEWNIGRAEGNPDGGSITVLEVHTIDDFLVAGIVPGQYLDRVSEGVGEPGTARELRIRLEILPDSFQPGVPSIHRKAPLANAGVVEAYARALLEAPL